MSQIKFSDVANFDIIRLREFLAQYDATVAKNAITAILASIKTLQSNPHNGAPAGDRKYVRKLTVDFGASGYLVFHKYYEKEDISLISTILHQRELYDLDKIGLVSELVYEVEKE